MNRLSPLLLLFVSCLCFATNDQLTKVIIDPSAPQDIAKEECVSEKYNHCNFQMCSLKSSISESPNCQEICKEQAETACQKH